MKKKSHHKPLCLRHAFEKLLAMKPEDRANYQPLDGYEEIALTNINRAAKPDKYFEAGKQAKHVADILGEKDKPKLPSKKPPIKASPPVPKDDGNQPFYTN